MLPVTQEGQIPQEDFVLKGAMLFAVWEAGIPHRPTRDVDLLGFGSPTGARLTEVFGDLCEVEVPDDGITFAADSVVADQIRAHEKYVGIRLRLRGFIGNARVALQIDVGFGDA